MFENDLSYRLKRMRELKKYTLETVANFLNISRSTYAYYETGKT